MELLNLTFAHSLDVGREANVRFAPLGTNNCLICQDEDRRPVCPALTVQELAVLGHSLLQDELVIYRGADPEPVLANPLKAMPLIKPLGTGVF